MPRHYSTVTPLGKAMARRGFRKAEVIQATGIADRTLTEVLAGRMDIPPGKLPALCRLLSVSPDYLLGAE